MPAIGRSGYVNGRPLPGRPIYSSRTSRSGLITGGLSGAAPLASPANDPYGLPYRAGRLYGPVVQT